MAIEYHHAIDEMLHCFVSTIKKGEKQIKQGVICDPDTLFDSFTNIFDKLPDSKQDRLRNSWFGAEVDQRKATFYMQYACNLYNTGGNECDVLNAMETCLNLFKSSLNLMETFEKTIKTSNKLKWVKVDQDGSILFDFDDCTIKTMDVSILKYSVHHNYGSALLTFENMEINIDGYKEGMLVMAVDELKQALNILDEICLDNSDEIRTGFGFRTVKNNKEEIEDYSEYVDEQYVVNKKELTYNEYQEAITKYATIQCINLLLPSSDNDIIPSDCDSEQETKTIKKQKRNKKRELESEDLSSSDSEEVTEEITHSIKQQSHKNNNSDTNRNKARKRKLESLSSSPVDNIYDGHRHKRRKLNDNNFNKNNQNVDKDEEQKELEEETDWDYSDDHRHKRRKLNYKDEEQKELEEETNWNDDLNFIDDSNNNSNDDEYINDCKMNLDALINGKKKIKDPPLRETLLVIQHKISIADKLMKKANHIQTNMLHQSNKNNAIIKNLRLQALGYLMGIKQDTSLLKQKYMIKELNNNIPPPLQNNTDEDITDLMDVYFACLHRVGKYYIFEQKWNEAAEKFSKWLENEVVDYQMVHPKIVLKWRYYMTVDQGLSFKNLKDLELAKEAYSDALKILEDLSNDKDKSDKYYIMRDHIDIHKQMQHVNIKFGEISNNNKEAIKFYDKAAKISDDVQYELDALFCLATTMVEMGNYQQALDLLQIDGRQSVQRCIDNYPCREYEKRQQEIENEIKKLRKLVK